jgi:putative spermidine/putrescine transport system permease protein
MIMSQKTYSDLPPVVKLPLYGFTVVVLALLIVPLAAALPIAFNSEPWFRYPLGGFSWRWFEHLLSSPLWRSAIVNSVIIATLTMILATALGTLAAIGLVNPRFPYRNAVMALTISPMVVPVVVLGLGLFICFSPVGLNYSYVGVILAHTVLATPFVVVTVTATLTRFDFRLMQAAANLGAGKVMAFRTVMLPIISPGVAAGAVFAFAASFDEVVMVLFIAGPDQRTLPKQMFTGLREQLDPTIIAAAGLMVVLTGILLAVLHFSSKRR